MGFQLPQPGFQLMQLPQQARQQYAQMPGTTPAMAQSQNLLAAQQAQQGQQPQNPLAMAGQGMQAGQDINKGLNGLMAPPQANGMAPQDALPIAPGMYDSQNALEKAQGGAGPMYKSPYQAAQAEPWWQKLLNGSGGGGGSGGFFSSLFGG